MMWLNRLAHIAVAIACMLGSTARAACPPNFSGTEVFGVDVCAARGVSPAALDHAAQVLQRNLDFDSSGEPDNVKVVSKLRQQRAAFLVVRRERQIDRFFDARGNEAFTVVFEFEMVTRGGRFDPTLEESLHLVTQFGYALVFPSVFGEFRGSQIAQLHDEAKSKNYFSYEDPTCDYGCMITEFTYWAITSLRGQQASRHRFAEISHEWKLNTPAKVSKYLPELARLLGSSSYNLLP